MLKPPLQRKPTSTEPNVTYMTPGGPLEQPAFTMPPSSRKTIRVNDISPVNHYPIDASRTDLSIRVHGDRPIVAERSMYWGAATPLGEACHDSIGTASPHARFYLPDGETDNGWETWTLVQNPNPQSVTVEIAYLTPTGKGDVKFTDTVPAGSRKTYGMSDRIPYGRAAVMVTCKTSGKKVMVERSMYWNTRGAGTDTLGGYSD